MSKRIKGFTLVELLTVVTVLGVLAAIAFPSMRDYMDKQRLVSQVRVISELAQFARSEAIKHSGTTSLRSISMNVAAPTPSTWYVGLINGDASCNSAATCVINQAGDPATPYFRSATECAGCIMTSHAVAARIVFDMRGVATTTGNADQLITLRSPLGKQLSVSVNRLGRISLCTPGGSVGGYPTC